MEKELQLQGTLCHTQDPASPAGLHITNSFLTPASFYMAEGGIPSVFGFLAHCLLFISFPSVLFLFSSCRPGWMPSIHPAALERCAQTAGAGSGSAPGVGGSPGRGGRGTRVAAQG